jgi:hypothetical protein
MSVSLDRDVALVDGSADRIAAGGSDDALGWTGETVHGAGAHLVGAATYAVRAAYWPSASGPFAEPEYRLLVDPAVPGAGERIFPAPLTLEPVGTVVRGGAVAHVVSAHP